MPFIPNQTGIAVGRLTPDGPEFTYGCCAPQPAHQQELSRKDHLLGRPVNAFLNPSNKKRSNLQKNEFWVEAAKGAIPAGAIQGGQDVDGTPLFVARAECEGSLTPGKVRTGQEIN